MNFYFHQVDRDVVLDVFGWFGLPSELEAD